MCAIAACQSATMMVLCSNVSQREKVYMREPCAPSMVTRPARAPYKYCNYYFYYYYPNLGVQQQPAVQNERNIEMPFRSIFLRDGGRSSV